MDTITGLGDSFKSALRAVSFYNSIGVLNVLLVEIELNKINSESLNNYNSIETSRLCSDRILA